MYSSRINITRNRMKLTEREECKIEESPGKHNPSSKNVRFRVLLDGSSLTAFGTKSEETISVIFL